METKNNETEIFQEENEVRGGDIYGKITIAERFKGDLPVPLMFLAYFGMVCLFTAIVANVVLIFVHQVQPLNYRHTSVSWVDVYI